MLDNTPLLVAGNTYAWIQSTFVLSLGFSWFGDHQSEIAKLRLWRKRFKPALSCESKTTVDWIQAFVSTLISIQTHFIASVLHYTWCIGTNETIWQDKDFRKHGSYNRFTDWTLNRDEAVHHMFWRILQETSMVKHRSKHALLRLLTWITAEVYS